MTTKFKYLDENDILRCDCELKYKLDLEKAYQLKRIADIQWDKRLNN